MTTPFNIEELAQLEHAEFIGQRIDFKRVKATILALHEAKLVPPRVAPVTKLQSPEPAPTPPANPSRKR